MRRAVGADGERQGPKVAGILIPVVFGGLLMTGLALVGNAAKAKAAAPTRAPPAPTRRRRRRAPRAEEPKRRRRRKRKSKALPGRAGRPPKPAGRGPIPTHKVKLKKGKARRRKGTPRTPPKPSTPVLSAKQAAQALYEYASRLVSAGRASALGTKNRRNSKVKAWQAAMGRIKDDGIYGPATRRRGKELLGMEFPVRRRAPRPGPPPPAPRPLAPASESDPVPEPPILLSSTAPTRAPAPAGRSARVAAAELLEYVRGVGTKGRARKLGYRGKPNAMIRAAQEDLGFSDADSDGIYGPQTRAAGKELLGVTFPAR